VPLIVGAAVVGAIFAAAVLKKDAAGEAASHSRATTAATPLRLAEKAKDDDYKRP